MKNPFKSWINTKFGRAQKPEGLEAAADSIVFVVLDTETTGLDPLRDRILSLGAIRVQQGSIRVREGMELFLEQVHFDQESVPIHGILRQGRHERVSEAEALKHFQEYAEGAVLVGHHLAFDLRMLNLALERNGMGKLRQPALDTGMLYQKTLLNSPLLRKKEHYSLDDLAHKFDLSCKDRHTALGDAYITGLAFLHILDRLEGRGPLTLDSLLRMGRVQG